MQRNIRLWLRQRAMQRCICTCNMSEIHVSWEDNGSLKYDGVPQDISRKFVVEEIVAVGDSVTIKWGRRAQVWKAVVVDLLDDNNDGK